MSSRSIATSIVVILIVSIVVIAGIGFYVISSMPRSSTSTSFAISSSLALTTLTTLSTKILTESSFNSSSTSSSYSSTSTAPESTNATIIVLEDLGTQLNYLNTRNIEALANFYSGSSVVNWTGQAGGLGGTYSGTSDILILYIGSFSHVSNLVAHTSNLSATVYDPSDIALNFDLFLQGTSTTLGNLSASVRVSQDWQNQNGNWIIQHEIWNYLSFTTINPVTSTVFPQWGLALAGRNPDLASEHLLEWYGAPYFAAGIYGAIIILFGAAVLRRKGSK